MEVLVRRELCGVSLQVGKVSEDQCPGSVGRQNGSPSSGVWQAVEVWHRCDTCVWW